MNDEKDIPQVEGRKSPLFKEKGVANFVAFGETLRKIHARLLVEGYKIEDGTITKPPHGVIAKP